MSICSYFTVKQRDLPEMETVVSSSEVKRAIGVKRVTDEEGDSSESKRATRIHILNYKYGLYM